MASAADVSMGRVPMNLMSVECRVVWMWRLHIIMYGVLLEWVSTNRLAMASAPDE
jgi:hypothetical protein